MSSVRTEPDLGWPSGDGVPSPGLGWPDPPTAVTTPDAEDPA